MNLTNFTIDFDTALQVHEKVTYTDIDILKDYCSNFSSSLFIYMLLFFSIAYVFDRYGGRLSDKDYIKYAKLFFHAYWFISLGMLLYLASTFL